MWPQKQKSEGGGGIIGRRKLYGATPLLFFKNFFLKFFVFSSCFRRCVFLCIFVFCRCFVFCSYVFSYVEFVLSAFLAVLSRSFVCCGYLLVPCVDNRL